MAIIDKTYHKLLNTILKDGFKYEDPNRKGVNRLQIPSYTIEHNFSDGFPAITTKKLYWKGVVGELLWFLRGDTNIKYLVDNNINIWNKDAYNYSNSKMKLDDWISFIKGDYSPDDNIYIANKNVGDLGRVYGAQWRNFMGYADDADQIYNLIKGLKENPMGTKHIVTAWNPAELDDMALPPCHWSFEILVEPIKCNSNFCYKEQGCLKNVCKNSPKYQFTLKWHQRSCDSFLGIPFNITSYALLAQIIGKMTNMVPKGIIGDLSNVHIYEPHLDSVKEQLTRSVDEYNHCELDIDVLTQVQLEQGLKYIDSDDIVIGNFKLKHYNSYPAIKEEMLAYNK